MNQTEQLQPTQQVAQAPFIVGVDSGKFQTKAVAYHITNGNILLYNEKLKETGQGENVLTFRTQMKKTNQVESRLSNVTILTHDGMSTEMSADDGTIDLERSKKAEVHRRSTYLAIARLLPNGAHLHLGIGTPLMVYQNTQQLEEYEKFMLGYKEYEEIQPITKIEFLVDGVEHIYYVHSLLTTPESSGYIKNNAHLHVDDDTVGVIDIGGLNVNASQYQRENVHDMNSPFKFLNSKQAITSDKGTHSLYMSIQKRLEDYTGKSIPIETLPRIVARGFYGRPQDEHMKNETSHLIKEELFTHLQEIKTDLQTSGWDFEQLPAVVMIGGGSQLFKEVRLKDEDLQYATVSENSIWENVFGFTHALAQKVAMEMRSHEEG